MISKTLTPASKPDSSIPTPPRHTPLFRREVDKQSSNSLRPAIWQFSSPAPAAFSPANPHAGHDFARIPVYSSGAAAVQRKEENTERKPLQTQPLAGANPVPLQRICPECEEESGSRPEGEEGAELQSKTLQRQPGEEELKEEEEEEEEAVSNPQPKLTVGARNDIYEQEADRVAAEVSAFHKTWGASLLGRGVINRLNVPKVLGYTAMKRPLSRISAQARRQVLFANEGRAGRLLPGIEARIMRGRGSGTAVPKPVKNLMALRTGYDFSQVRVTTGPEAETLNRSLGARAFTLGSDIWLGQNESPHDVRLMAHELTHVVQQGAARRIQPQSNAFSQLWESDRSEREADRVSDAVLPPETGKSGAASQSLNAQGSFLTHAQTQVARQSESEAEETPSSPDDTAVNEQILSQASNQGRGSSKQKGGEVIHSSARTPEEEPLLREQGPIPSDTLTCVKKWQYCRAPYRPGTWAARFTYHCPRLILPWGIILPGTTRPAFATIPDEFVGTSPSGRDRYRCRPRSTVVANATIADIVATVVTRTQLYRGQAACHAGFRGNLRLALEAMFRPSGGGRPAGIRVNQTAPGGGGRPYPCP